MLGLFPLAKVTSSCSKRNVGVDHGNRTSLEYVIKDYVIDISLQTFVQSFLHGNIQAKLHELSRGLQLTG